MQNTTPNVSTTAPGAAVPTTGPGTAVPSAGAPGTAVPTILDCSLRSAVGPSHFPRKIKTWINARTTVEGLHFYPCAGVHANLADVSYLCNLHRHQFGVRAKIGVREHDREIEFIQVKHFINSIYPLDPKYGIANFGAQSCEMIAKHIADKLFEKYGPDRDYEVEVDEDGENSAIYETRLYLE